MTLFGGTEADPTRAEDLRPREGLPNFFANIAAGKEVRVAFLGGSITQAEGWRPKTLAFLRSRWPGVTFTEIHAALAGTDTNYGACRVGTQVLDQAPDLLFVEFRVNGGALDSLEGIVRQTWNRKPRTDICFVYTINEGMVKDISAGNTPKFGAVLEKVANHYGIPSIDLGLEVLRRINAGTMVFKGDTAPEGVPVFAKDGTHPGNEGHTVYTEVISRSLLAMGGVGAAGPHRLPDPLSADPWTEATLVPLSAASLEGSWTPVVPKTDPVVLKAGFRSAMMFTAGMVTSSPGGSITIRFQGTKLGFIDIPAMEATTLTAQIDGAPPITIERKETYRKDQGMCRPFFLPTLAPGQHTVRIEVKDLPAGASWYVGPLLVVGTITGK